LSGLHEVTLFKQRDMDVRPLGFELGETPLDEINDINLNRPGLSCATGDSFVDSSQDIEADLFDMESYAIAKLCVIEKIDFSCFKYVSDNADGDASQDWKRNVSSGSSVFKELLDSLDG
jgi:adenosylhomocysteine nucleosidase